MPERWGVLPERRAVVFDADTDTDTDADADAYAYAYADAYADADTDADPYTTAYSHTPAVTTANRGSRTRACTPGVPALTCCVLDTWPGQPDSERQPESSTGRPHRQLDTDLPRFEYGQPDALSLTR